MAAGGGVLGPSTFSGAAALRQSSGQALRQSSGQAEPPMIGIHFGAVSLVDEGTDKVLDTLREMAAIDTLFLATFTYGRGIAGVSSKVKIWPGIDIDIPTGPKEKKTQPDDVYDAVNAAFDGGAHGVLLSRKYSEMPLANLRAAGRAIRDLKLG